MKEQRFVRFLRFRHKVYRLNLKGLNTILGYLSRILFSCEIPASVIIGDNVVFAHYGLGVTIHGRTIIGDNVKIYQNVTIGSRNGIGPPKIGNNVLIGAGACILGDITIGNNVQIGANAVVIKNLIDNSIAVGVPARVINS